MAIFNVVIADSDEDFVEAFERFLGIYYHERFQAVCITSAKYLNDYIRNTSKKIDILLTTPEFFPTYRGENINTVIFMTDGRITSELEKYPAIEKYQSAQRIVKTIIDIYAENNPNEVHSCFRDKKTKVVGVFSPNGGAGKTTISIAMSKRLVQRGTNVFYLNLEDISSSPLFFDCNLENNLSHVLFFLKERSKNLSLKIEAASHEDLNSGIHYFAPPDSALEINEINGEDIKELINQLKSLNRYDSIIIDMSCAVDEINMKIFKTCDSIIYILTPDETSRLKTAQTIKIFQMAEKKELKEMHNKISFVMNKYNEKNTDFQEELYFEDKKIEVRIPDMPEVFSRTGEKQDIGLDSQFGENVNILVSRILGVKEDGD
ncbi:MAG: AAA family ATPase [Ignavibacteriales bacterium]